MHTSRQPVSFIATDNPDKARVFFCDVLGLELLEQSAFALAFSDGGHLLRVQIVPELRPAAYTVHGWRVSNISDEIERLNSKGVKFHHFDQLSQDALGIWTSPDGHKIVWFSDPSGNILSLTQHAKI